MTRTINMGTVSSHRMWLIELMVRRMIPGADERDADVRTTPGAARAGGSSGEHRRGIDGGHRAQDHDHPGHDVPNRHNRSVRPAVTLRHV